MSISFNPADMQRLKETVVGGQTAFRFLSRYTVEGAMARPAQILVIEAFKRNVPVLKEVKNHPELKAGALKSSLKVQIVGKSARYSCLFYGIIVSEGIPSPYVIRPKDYGTPGKKYTVTHTFHNRNGKIVTATFERSSTRVLKFHTDGGDPHAAIRVVHPEMEGSRWIKIAAYEAANILFTFQSDLGKRVISLWATPLPSETELEFTWIEDEVVKLMRRFKVE